MAEPTIIEIHNYAGGAAPRPREDPEGVEVSRWTPQTEFTHWMWNAGPDNDETAVDFHAGKTYVIYEIDSDD